MKIYIVTHFYDNGESYEDYREYTDYFMFSTEDKAYAFYCEKILLDYEGRYSMYEKELDTQKQTLLEVSPWVECSSMYQYEPCFEDYEPCLEDYEPDPWEQYADSTDYVDDYTMAEYESIQDELRAEDEWLTTKREQGEILDEIEEDKLNDELAESEKVWASLGMLD